MGEDGELGADRFALRLARYGDRKRRGSEPIVDADLMGAQAQLKAIIEDHRQYVIAQIGILVDGDCMTRWIRL